MSTPADKNSHDLPDDLVAISPAAKRRDDLRRQSLRTAARLNFTTALFFLLALACLLLHYWLAKQMALRPQIQNVDLEHVSLQDWAATFRIDFPDTGLPPAARKLDPVQRRLPQAIINGQDQSLSITKTNGKKAETLGLKFYVPEGTMPGVYSGALVVADAKGRLPEQKLPLVIEVLDPLERFRLLLVYFGVVTAMVLLGILWMNPLPFGHLRTLVVDRSIQQPNSRLQTQDLLGNHRGKIMLLVMTVCYGALWMAFRGVSSFDPASPFGLRMLGVGVLLLGIAFAWTNPFGRKRLALKAFDDEMPEGEIEFSRTGLFGGKSRISVVLRLWDEETEQMKVMGDWPRSVLDLELAAVAPMTRNLPNRRPPNAQDIFVKPVDSQMQRALCFQIIREPPKDNEY